MLQRLLSCVALAVMLALSGCGGGSDVAPPSSTPTSAFVAIAQASNVGRGGGSVSLTAADGTQYTFSVPAGALAKDTTLSLTTAEPGDGQRFRVVAGPDGLVFQAGLPATLTIRLPAGRELPTTGGLIYNGAPVPSIRNADGSISLQLYQLNGSATPVAALARATQAAQREVQAASVEGSGLVCRNPSVNGGPQAGTASYDTIELARYVDCVTGQMEDLIDANDYNGAIRLAMSLDALLQRTNLDTTSFLGVANSLVCRGRQRALDALAPIIIADLDDLQAILAVAYWDMYAQKIGHVCPGQPDLSAAVQPKIDDALTFLDADPNNITSADVASAPYIGMRAKAERSLRLRHGLVAIARALGRPITPVIARAPVPLAGYAGARARANAAVPASTYSAETVADAQLQGRLEPAALKNLLASPWQRCRSAGDFVPLMALVDLYGALDALKGAAQYCGTQLSLEVLDNQNVSTATLSGLGGVAARQNQTAGSVNATADGVIKLTGPIGALRCPANVASSEELVVRFAGVEVRRLSVAAYLTSTLQFNISDLRAAASLANANIDPQPLTLERTGAACSAYWGAAPAPLLSVTLGFQRAWQIMFKPDALSSNYMVMNADGSGLRASFASDIFDYYPPSGSPDNLRMAVTRDLSIIIVDVGGSVQNLLTADTTYSFRQPAWSPDGRQIAFLRLNHDGDPALMVMNVDGSGQTVVATAPNTAYGDVRWLPDGNRLAFRAYDRRNYWPDADPNRTGHFVMNRDGSGLTRLVNFTIDISGSRLVNDDDMPMWSPDGTQMTFTRTYVNNSVDLMVANSDGTGQRTVINFPSSRVLYGAYCWLPDGQRIAFMRRDSFSISTIKPDGTGLTEIYGGPSEPGLTCAR